MIKPRWITTDCQCRLTRKDGTLVWIIIYLTANGDWYMYCNAIPEIKGRFKTITEAKKAAIAKFERIEAQND